MYQGLIKTIQLDFMAMYILILHFQKTGRGLQIYLLNIYQTLFRDQHLLKMATF